MPKPIDEDVARLLGGVIENHARFEVLRLLHRERRRSFTARDVALKLGVNPASVEQDLALLCGRGLLSVTIANDLRYSYRPGNETLDAEIERLMRLWAERRDDVEALLKGTDPVRAFAAAFRIRRNDG